MASILFIRANTLNYTIKSRAFAIYLGVCEIRSTVQVINIENYK